MQLIVGAGTTTSVTIILIRCWLAPWSLPGIVCVQSPLRSSQPVIILPIVCCSGKKYKRSVWESVECSRRSTQAHDAQGLAGEPRRQLGVFAGHCKNVGSNLGTTNMLIEEELLVLFFEINPKGWHRKCKAVPWDIADASKDLVSGNCFMCMCWNTKQKPGKRNLNGTATKRSRTTTNSQENNKGSDKNNKRNKKTQSTKTNPKDDGLYCHCNCKDAPCHKLIKVWSCLFALFGHSTSNAHNLVKS